MNRRPVFLAGFLMGRAGLAALAEGAEPLTDDRPVLAYATRSAEESGANELALIPLFEAHLEPVDEVLAFELPEEERKAVRAIRAKNLADLGAAAVLREVESGAAGGGAGVLAIVDEALARNPESVVANRWRADALVLAGRGEEALAAYEATLAIEPDDFLARHGFAVALHRMGRIADALPHYARAAALRPDDAEVHNNYGAALASAGRLDLRSAHRGGIIGSPQVPLVSELASDRRLIKRADSASHRFRSA